MRIAQFKAFEWRWAVFVAAGLTMISMGASVGNVSAAMTFVSVLFMVVGGVLMVTGLIYLLPSSNRLDINDNGFSYRRGLTTSFCPWEDCSEFSTWQQKVFGMNGVELVTFDRKKPLSDSKTNIEVTGRNSVLPGTYGLEAEKLAETLNRFRARYRNSERDVAA